MRSYLNLGSIAFATILMVISEEAKASPGSDSDSDHGAARIPEGYELSWTVNQDRELVMFELGMTPGSWMGIGLGAHGMYADLGADMIMCECDEMGDVTCHDMKAVGEVVPKKDAS